MKTDARKLLEFLAHELPALIDFSDKIEMEDARGTSLGDAFKLSQEASWLLDAGARPCSPEMLPVLEELCRIAPEQRWEWEAEAHGVPEHLSAASGATEIYVEVGDCSLSKRIRYKWTVVTLGPCEGTGPEDPAPSVDEVFSSHSALEIARRAAAEDYTANIHYA